MHYCKYSVTDVKPYKCTKFVLYQVQARSNLSDDGFAIEVYQKAEKLLIWYCVFRSIN